MQHLVYKDSRPLIQTEEFLILFGKTIPIITQIPQITKDNGY